MIARSDTRPLRCHAEYRATHPIPDNRRRDLAVIAKGVAHLIRGNLLVVA
jgi:hypothetical protein